MGRPTHIRVQGTSRSLCGNATIRSTFVEAPSVTCKVCKSKHEMNEAMKWACRNRDAINAADGGIIPPHLPEQIVAYNRGAAEERAHIVAWLRRRDDGATYPLVDIAEAIENGDDRKGTT